MWITLHKIFYLFRLFLFHKQLHQLAHQNLAFDKSFDLQNEEDFLIIIH